MSDTSGLSPAAQQFVDDMTAAGAAAWIDGTQVLYKVQATDGQLAPEIITTGVGLADVQSWPAIPPHWVHLPETLTFPQTNEEATECPGWKRHSRDYGNPDPTVPPALSWLRHVRGCLTIAIRREV